MKASPQKWFITLCILPLLFNVHAGTNNQLNFNTSVKSQFQSDDGFIWFLTSSDVWRYDGYQTLNLSEIFDVKRLSPIKELLSLYEDENGKKWLGTDKNGLFLIADSGVTALHKQELAQYRHSKLISHSGWMWSATEKGLIQFNEKQFILHEYSDETQVSENGITVSLTAFKNDLIIVNTDQVIRFSVDTGTFRATDDLPAGIIRDLIYFDQHYLSTDSGIYSSTDLTNWTKSQTFDFLLDKKIRSVKKHQGHYWVITIFDGVYRLNSANGQITHFNDEAGVLHELSSNFVTNIFFDHSGLVWIVHFNGAVDTIDPKKETFGLNALSFDLACQLEENYLAMTESNTHWIISSQSGIHLIDKNSKTCQLLNTNHEGQLVFDKTVPTALMNHNGLGILIGSSDGLYQINEDKGIHKITDAIKFINFLTTSADDQLLIGALDGLYQFNPQSMTVSKVPQSNSIQFYDYALRVSTGKLYFATDQGIQKLEDGKIISQKKINSEMPTENVLSIHMIDDILFIGTLSDGLYSFDLTKRLLQKINLQILGENLTVRSMTSDQHNLWLGSDQGLIKVNVDDYSSNQYSYDNGLQSESFILNSVYKTKSGQLYFGGNKGFNFFLPNEITTNKIAPKTNFTQVKRFNKPVQVNSASDNDFNLQQSINKLSELTLTHKDYVMAFEFAAMDFNNPTANKYQYRLFPFEQAWNETNAQQRLATYTNLPSGHFELQIKGSNNAGVWSEKPSSLGIHVLPPPWLTWWAITSYILFALGAIYWYVQRKIKTNQKIAAMLRIEVAEKTKELNIQKQKVESLLVKKNELFSNVSHEFRTPLTLILGPIKELINKQVNQEDIRSLKMINRSANRLLSLVEQLLQIARVSDIERVKTTPQNTQKQIASLVDSFQYLADSKHIGLELKRNDQAVIDVTDQFIDAVLGNLVSNAIKYTQSGGSVEVSAKASAVDLVLSVKDSGAGLTAEQGQDIFKRFKRLDSHQSIEGIGIGLSVVEEVVKINHGKIQVNSQLGVGSEFIVRIPLSDVSDANEVESISSLVTQLQTESLDSTPLPFNEVSVVEDNSLNTVLVIEDNHDMREHIIDIIRPHYNVFSAENGLKGVAKAIEQVPDIIISDVMMPEMDGFKVARVIRADERTSHIPLMLLTALNDKSNRIKGWRENVDAYMTKPFDRDELLIQLENMLTIRDILKRKAGQLVKQGQSQNTTLPKKDQQFIDKLIETIASNYHDPILNRAKIASAMAVSDRQLQRKVKALIDQNPMDMLREYRLNKSKQLLKDGYQVSQVADDCGFNSLSYFSQCFKAQFSLSPKQYQQTAK